MMSGMGRLLVAETITSINVGLQYLEIQNLLRF